MHNAQNIHNVVSGTRHSWTMQGRPGQNANLPLVLKLDFVVLPAGVRGFTIDLAGSQIPAEIVLLEAPVDVAKHDGNAVWVVSGNGLEVLFDDEVYTLVRAMEVSDDAAWGVLYFHWYPPTEFGGGDIVYDERQNLELG